jgi:replicative DNA helicase
MTAQLRVPPQSAEAEQSLLSALLLDSQALQRIPHVPPEAFFASFHRQVYEAILDLAAKGKGIDPITVFERMRASDSPHDMLQQIFALAQYAPSAANARRYAEVILERWTLRRAASAADQIAGWAFADGAVAAEVVDKAQMELAKIAQVKSRRDPQHIHQSIADYLGLLQALSEGKNPAIPTGIGGLDQILNGGIRRGEMMVIGARPKHGKTALSLTMARNMARDYTVLFISQEMPVSQLMHRHTAAMGSVDLSRILRADASDGEMWSRVGDAADRLGKLNLVHDDQSAQSLLDVRRKAMQVKRQHGLDVLFVDFLQLMQGAGEDNRNRELDVISNGLKALALDLDIGLVLLSQMSRKADEHYGRATMTHLRDSGAIEAAADQIALLFTDHAHPLSKRKPEFQGFSELEIVAHRNGPQGLVPLQFIGQYQQIGDWMGDIPQHRKDSQGGGL